MQNWKTVIWKGPEEKREACPTCGKELGPDDRCYNSACPDSDSVSQYDVNEIEVNAFIDAIAEKHDVSEREVKDQFKIGSEIELEHTDDIRKAEQIALDHLFEIPDYYTRLKKMEKEAKPLAESQAQEIGWEYERFNKEHNIDLNDLVYGPEGFMTIKYPNGFPDFNGDIIFNERYWNEMKAWAKERKGIDLDHKVTEDLVESKSDESQEDLNEELLTKENESKLNFHDLVGDRELVYDEMPVTNQLGEEAAIYFTFKVNVYGFQVIDFICEQYNLAQDILTVEDAQTFIDQVAAEPEDFEEHLAEDFFDIAKMAAQEAVDKDSVEGYGPHKYDVDEDEDEEEERPIDEASSEQSVDGLNVDMNDFDIDFRDDLVSAYMGIWRPNFDNAVVTLRFEYNGYIENAKYKWEPDGPKTYVPYGETNVLYKDGKGGLESVTIDEMKPDNESYERENGDKLGREDALDILDVTEDQLKKLEEAARKIASDQLRSRIAEQILDEQDLWPDRD